MEFETVEQNERVYVSVNNVRAPWFAMPDPDGVGYAIYEPQPVQGCVTLAGAIAIIAEWMGNWYTVTQAATRLVELGAFDSPPSTQMMGIWCRTGKFPGAVKILGRGARGSGGQWRISEAGLVAFIAERRGQ